MIFSLKFATSQLLSLVRIILSTKTWPITDYHYFFSFNPSKKSSITTLIKFHWHAFKEFLHLNKILQNQYKIVINHWIKNGFSLKKVAVKWKIKKKVSLYNEWFGNGKKRKKESQILKKTLKRLFLCFSCEKYLHFMVSKKERHTFLFNTSQIIYNDYK